MLETEPNIIAFSGTHGTGKTFALKKCVRDFEMAGCTSIGVVSETARRCPLPINGDSTEASQLWIFSAHIAAEIRTAAINEVVIADRSCFDAIAYSIVLGYGALAVAMEAMALRHLSAYKQIVVHTIENNDWFVDDGTRWTNKQARVEVEKALLGLYAKHNVEIIKK